MSFSYAWNSFSMRYYFIPLHLLYSLAPVGCVCTYTCMNAGVPTPRVRLGIRRQRWALVLTWHLV